MDNFILKGVAFDFKYVLYFYSEVCIFTKFPFLCLNFNTCEELQVTKILL